MEQFLSPTIFFEKLNLIEGSNSKISFIRAHKEERQIIKALQLCIDPRKVFRVTSKCIDGEPAGNFIEDMDYPHWLVFNQMLGKMADGTFTIQQAKAQLYIFFYGISRRTWKIMTRVLDKNLRMGISVTLLNKAIPGTIPTFDVALCKPYNPVMKEPFNFRAEPKLDGVRGLLYTSRRVVYSRKGIPLNNVEEIVKEACGIFPAGTILDGELLDTDWNQTISTLHSQEKAGKHLVYHVFDVFHESELIDKRTNSLRARQKNLSYYISQSPVVLKHIRHVGGEQVTRHSVVEFYLEKFESIGYEGLVLKDLSAPYPFKRSNTWQKLKSFQSNEFTIIDCKEGEGKLAGTLGAVCVDVDGVTTWVGSGFTNDERDMLWEYEPLIGSIAEIKYQSITKDGALLFPTFLRLRQEL